jgi:hypothetical protein
MHKTKNKRNKLAKKTRRYRKYYGGNGETSTESTNKTSEILKESEGIFDVISDKLSGYSSSVFNYGKEKGLRLLGLQTINPTETTEETNKINESVNNATETMNKATEGVSKIGSDVVNVFDKGSAAIINNINDVLGSEIVNDSFKESAKDLGETSAKILHNFNEAVSTPEFKEETKVAMDNAAEIAEIFIQAADKPINEAVDVLNEAGEKAVSGIASGSVKAATSAAAAIPFYGSIINIGKMANDITSATQNVVKSSNTATEAVLKAIKETNENINEGLENLEKTKHKVENLSDMSKVNMPSIPTVPKIDEQNIQKEIVQGAGGFKKINNEKYQVAGRIMDSINEFKDPINFSIMKRDNKTKKHSLKGKGKSKRVRFNL